MASPGFNAIVKPVLDEIGASTENIIARICNPTNAIVELSTAALAKIRSIIAASVANSIANAELAEERVKGRIASEIELAIANTASLIDSLSTNMANSTAAIIGDADENKTNLIDWVTSGVTTVIDESTALIDTITLKITDDVLPSLTEIKGFATATLGAVGSLSLNLLTGLTDLPLGLTKAFDPLVEGIKRTMKEGFKDVMGGFFQDASSDTSARIDGVLRMIEDDPEVSEEIKALTAPGFLPLTAVGGFIAMIALPMILTQFLAPILDPFAQKVGQKVQAKVRQALLPVGQSADAFHRGFMDEGRFLDTAQKQGFTEDDINGILEMVKLRPQSLELVDYWRRGLIKPDALAPGLRELGWSEEWQRIIEAAAFPPPGVQDLVTMAVREVFTPEVAERFGQFDDLPPEFIVHARTVGLSEEWATRIWAAHWGLPSVQMGFQMLHRTIEVSGDSDADTITLPSGATIQNVIGEKTLELLLRSSDVMPFWRAPIKSVSYNPFSRVDVRRMHKLGVLDEDGVFRAYLDLGYEPEKARALLAFTLELNKDSVKVEKDRERDLSKGDIIGLFNDGLLDFDVARVELKGIGYDDDESTLLIQREEMQRLTKIRKADIDLIITKARSKVLTFDVAQGQLERLDLSPRERDQAIARIERVDVERVRAPSKADLDAWYGLDLMSALEYADELRGLGFHDKYVDLYVIAETGEKEADIAAVEARELRAARPRSVTKGQLDRLRRLDILSDEGYVKGLQTLGYAPVSVTNFTQQIEAEIEQAALEEAERLERGIEAPLAPRLPSRGELDRFALTNLIGANDYVEGLRRLGFEQTVIDHFLNLMIRRGGFGNPEGADTPAST